MLTYNYNRLEVSPASDTGGVFSEIWKHYEENLLESFPYIGGDDVSGTRNLTGAYCFVSMGEVLKGYGAKMEDVGRLMVLAYERRFNAMPGIVKMIARKFFTNVKSLKRTDWFVTHLYVPKGFFTPPFETKESLKKRLDGLYSRANVQTLNAEGIFCCVK